MNNIFKPILLILFSVLLTCCNSSDKAINKELNETAVNLNLSAPVMLDDYTRFDGASVSPDNIFIYRYTVLNTSNPDSLINVVEASLRENIRKEFSENPQLAFFKENNVVLEYVYNDENKHTIRLLRINPEDYQ